MFRGGWRLINCSRKSRSSVDVLAIISEQCCGLALKNSLLLLRPLSPHRLSSVLKLVNENEWLLCMRTQREALLKTKSKDLQFPPSKLSEEAAEEMLV